MVELTAAEVIAFTDRFMVGDGCWDWLLLNGTRQRGYGRLMLRGRTASAHRISYELFVGPIPEGLYIDHLCRNRSCVRPDHLEPVTNGENVRRGVGVTAQNARKTHCGKGHALAGGNLYRDPEGDRGCRTCRSDARRRCDRRRAARERAKGAPSGR